MRPLEQARADWANISRQLTVISLKDLLKVSALLCRTDRLQHKSKIKEVTNNEVFS